MSLSPGSSTGRRHAPSASGNAGGGAVKAIAAVPCKVAGGVADVGAAVGDAASATVSFSTRALQALTDGGMAVVHGVESVAAYPFELAADAAMGVGHAVESGIQLVSDGVSAAINGVEAVANGVANAAQAVAIDLPLAVAKNVSDMTQAALGDATTVAGAAAGVAALRGESPAKVISSIL